MCWVLFFAGFGLPGSDRCLELTLPFHGCFCGFFRASHSPITEWFSWSRILLHVCPSNQPSQGRQRLGTCCDSSQGFLCIWPKAGLGKTSASLAWHSGAVGFSQYTLLFFHLPTGSWPTWPPSDFSDGNQTPVHCPSSPPSNCRGLSFSYNGDERKWHFSLLIYGRQRLTPPAAS